MTLLISMQPISDAMTSCHDVMPSVNWLRPRQPLSARKLGFMPLIDVWPLFAEKSHANSRDANIQFSKWLMILQYYTTKKCLIRGRELGPSRDSPNQHMQLWQLPRLRDHQVQNWNRQQKRENFQNGQKHLLSDRECHLRPVLQGMPQDICRQNQMAFHYKMEGTSCWHLA